jgi:hypothetical protein
MRRHEGSVIVDDNGDIGFFRAAEDAEKYLEPWCVEYGITAYDAEGRLLRIEPHRSGHKVMLLVPDRPSECAEKLGARLRQFLIAAQPRLDVDVLRQASFAELVEMGLAHFPKR